MNRSIFQIWHGFCFKRFVLFLIISTILCIFFNFNIIIVNCSNNIINYELQKYIFREIIWKNSKIMVPSILNSNHAITALDIFSDNVLKGKNINYSYSKYFLNKNGILIPFNNKSSYSHPNLFCGHYKNCFINIPFTHSKLTNFGFFSEIDIIGNQKVQYVSDLIYVVPDNLAQVFLNSDFIDLNTKYIELNELLIKKEIQNALEIQSYCNLNIINFDNHIKKCLKF